MMVIIEKEIKGETKANLKDTYPCQVKETRNPQVFIVVLATFIHVYVLND